MIRDSSYWEAMKVVPLIIWLISFGNLYEPSVWYKLIDDKTYIGAYISIVGGNTLANFY
jgi:hypothetical protein